MAIGVGLSARPTRCPGSALESRSSAVARSQRHAGTRSASGGEEGGPDAGQRSTGGSVTPELEPYG